MFTTNALRSALGTRPFRYYPQVESTQNIAREWAAEDPSLNGAVVIADEQTAGRGRQGRVWRSPPDAGLMCSVILRPQIAPEHLPRLTIAGSVAVVGAFPSEIYPRVALKWPNDVLIGGRKVCGVLAEANWQGDDLPAVILGIGINVRADFSGSELGDSATSLEPELGRRIDRLALLAALLARVDHWAAHIDSPALMDVYACWLGTLGKRVTVYTAPDKHDSPAFEGVAESVAEDGALAVRLDSGEVRRIVAADVGLAEG
jgi:BirA family transcriptional regulator, biotin operon repressor / biotin---[acetyl-CoA-carboxylase] ligase